jgi:hypothetical protein
METLAPKTYGREFDFTVAVSNCIWAVETSLLREWPAIPPIATNRILRQQVAPDKFITVIERPTFDSPRKWRTVFTGKEIAQFTYFPHTEFVTNKTAIGTDAILMLEKGDAPSAYDTGIILPLWFAFASRCYLDSAPQGRLKPIWFITDEMRVNGFTTFADIKRYDSGKGLPATVSFFFDETAWNALSAVKAPPRPSTPGGPSPKPALWAEYIASDFTNTSDGIAIPSTFVLNLYEAFDESRSGTRSPAGERITGVVRDITSNVDPMLFDLRMKGAASVVDRRLLEGTNPAEGIQYRLVDSAPQPAESKELEMLQGQLNLQQGFSRRRVEPAGSGRRFPVVVIVGVIAGAFAWIIFRRRNRPK